MAFHCGFIHVKSSAQMFCGKIDWINVLGKKENCWKCINVLGNRMKNWLNKCFVGKKENWLKSNVLEKMKMLWKRKPFQKIFNFSFKLS